MMWKMLLQKKLAENALVMKYVIARLIWHGYIGWTNFIYAYMVLA